MHACFTSLETNSTSNTSENATQKPSHMMYASGKGEGLSDGGGYTLYFTLMKNNKLIMKIYVHFHAFENVR